MDFLGHDRYSETNLFFPHWKLKKTLKFFKPDWLVVTPTHMGIFFYVFIWCFRPFWISFEILKISYKKSETRPCRRDPSPPPSETMSHFSAYFCLYMLRSKDPNHHQSLFCPSKVSCTELQFHQTCLPLLTFPWCSKSLTPTQNGIFLFQFHFCCSTPMTCLSSFPRDTDIWGPVSCPWLGADFPGKEAFSLGIWSWGF